MTTYKVNKVNSWNGWDPLKQVILGNVYTPDFFEDLPDARLRDSLQQLLYETHEDLDNIQKTLEDLGVDVVRCHPNSTQYAHLYEQSDNPKTPKTIMEWVENGQGLYGVPKPCLAPRDFFIVLGNKMLATQNANLLDEFLTSPGQHMINPDCVDLRLTEEYNNKLYTPNRTLQQLKNTKFKGPFNPRKEFISSKDFGPDFSFDWFDDGTNHQAFLNHHDSFCRAMHLSYSFWAPQITRVGDTLIIDTEEISNLDSAILKMYPEFKGANTAIGGHNDGSFNLPKPGLCIAAPWTDKESFKNTLPGWDILQIDTPIQMEGDWGSWKDLKHHTQGKWWLPGIEKKENTELKNFVDQWLNKWVGYAEETIFEVNMLSVDEKTILSLNYQEEVHAKLKEHGIEPIYCRFRHRNFWDAGLHCLTVDTVREGGMQNYFD